MTKPNYCTQISIDRNFLPEGFDYVVPPSFDEVEIERRRSLLPGTLTVEFQDSGLAIVNRTLETVQTFGGDPSLEFSGLQVAQAAVNSVYYLSKGGMVRDRVMRRNFELPKIDSMPFPLSRQGLFQEAARVLTSAIEPSGQLLKSQTKGNDSTPIYETRLARSLLDASLLLAAADVADELNEFYDGDGKNDRDVASIRLLTRDACMDMMLAAKSAFKRQGVHPSVAQFNDPESPLVSFWDGNGGGVAKFALRTARVTPVEAPKKLAA